MADTPMPRDHDRRFVLPAPAATYEDGLREIIAEYRRRAEAIFGLSLPPAVAADLAGYEAELNEVVSARLRAVDAEIAAKLREMERQVEARERDEARSRGRARRAVASWAGRRSDLDDRGAMARRVGDAYEAACELRRAGIAVGEPATRESAGYSVPSMRVDRRRAGRLPHDEDGDEPSWDDAVRLIER